MKKRLTAILILVAVAVSAVAIRFYTRRQQYLADMEKGRLSYCGYMLTFWLQIQGDP